VIFTHGETVTRQRAQTTADPYSTQPRPDWKKTPATVDIAGCGFDPGTSAESFAEPGRQPITTKPTVYAPYGSDIKAGDRLVVRGVTYDVDGNPADFRSPFSGWEAGMAVSLRVKEG
jgi:hypothetical protein